MLAFFTDVLMIIGLLSDPTTHTEQELTYAVNANQQPITQYIYDTQQDTEILEDWAWDTCND